MGLRLGDSKQRGQEGRGERAERIRSGNGDGEKKEASPEFEGRVWRWVMLLMEGEVGCGAVETGNIRSGAWRGVRGAGTSRLMLHIRCEAWADDEQDDDDGARARQER